MRLCLKALSWVKLLMKAFTSKVLSRYMAVASMNRTTLVLCVRLFLTVPKRLSIIPLFGPDWRLRDVLSCETG